MLPKQLKHSKIMINSSAPSLLNRARQFALPILVVVFCVTLGVLLSRFYADATIHVPGTGGTYIEGSVGSMQPLIPWFTVQNDVHRDISSLVFGGLLKYDPSTKKIQDDLASLVVSEGGRIYTVKLKEDLLWHDSSAEVPHPVTAEDVLFTYQTIQDPDFPNPLLRQNFLGVQIEKIDNRTVRFRLEEPYSFFASNLTLGLVPMRSFEGIPVSKLDQVLDFGFHPIGAGPYRFKSLVQTELSTEITLERFHRPIEPKFRLNQVVFRIFPDYATLLSDIRNIDGIRLVPKNEGGQLIIPRRFKAIQYSLPQYVALFLNLDHAILQDRQLRLGLQLGTNKQAIVDAINESLIVDTPLLEIDTTDWRYQYDPDAAQGAFFESDWHLPEKVRLQRLLEIHEANAAGVLKIAPIVLLDTGAILTVTGSVLDAGSGSTLNDIPILPHPTSTGSWIVGLPTHGGTGTLAIGINLIRLLDPKGKPIDSYYVWRTESTKTFKRATREQEVLGAFIASRDGNLPVDKQIAAQDMYLEGGFLRRRLSTDPKDIRVNDVGDRLTLTLLTSPEPPQYRQIAEIVAKEWAALGVYVGILVPETREEFEEKLLAREYDILLFGQSLLDNLDSYPYWHSSSAQKMSDSKFDLRIDAYNLSQYSSLSADALLEVIRGTSDERERQEALKELREVLKNDVPAIFLYSPLYAFAYHQDLRGVELGNLSLHSDRFLTLHNWYLREERMFRPGMRWWSFFPWLLSQK